MRDTLLLEIVQPVLHIGILLNQIVVTLLVHFITMVVDPQISIALTTIHKPHPKPWIERIMVNGDRLRHVPSKDRLLTRGPRFERLLSHRSDPFRARRAASIERAIGAVVEASRRLGTLRGRGSAIVMIRESAGRSERI